MKIFIRIARFVPIALLALLSFVTPVAFTADSWTDNTQQTGVCEEGYYYSNGECIKIPSDTTILGVAEDRLRAGDVDMETIPQALAYVINFIIALAGTISIVMLIYFALRMQLASGISGDTSGIDKAKKGMIAAMIGFIISISAWFIMARVIDLLTSATQQ